MSNPYAACPTCGHTKFNVFYSAPLTYECVACGARWVDTKPAIEVLNGSDAQSKRPALYGLPACDCCGHEPHPNTPCRWCATTP